MDSCDGSLKQEWKSGCKAFTFEAFTAEEEVQTLDCLKGLNRPMADKTSSLCTMWICHEIILRMCKNTVQVLSVRFPTLAIYNTSIACHQSVAFET